MTRIARRNLLKGLGLGASAYFLRPMIERAASAQGQTKSIKRIVFYLNGLGFHQDQAPADDGSGGIALNGWAPLAPHLGDMTIVDQLYCPFNLHLHGSRWLMTMMPAENEDADAPPGGPSFDRFLADRIGAQDPISSLTMAPFYRTAPSSQKGYPTISADAAGIVHPASSPLDTFGRLFGAAEGGMTDDEQAAAAQAALRRDLSILDFVHEDTKRVEQRFTGLERERFQLYLQSTRDLETQLARLADSKASCTPPTFDEEALADRDVRAEQVDAAVELTALSMLCGFTRIVSLNVISRDLTFLGSGGIGTHTMWHGGTTPEAPGLFYGFHAQAMANLWTRLKEIPEDGGTMADHTALVWLNSSGARHHNSSYHHFAMVLSGPDHFRKGWIQLSESDIGSQDVRATVANRDPKRIPGNGADTSLSDFFVTVGRHLDPDITTFGHPDINQGVIGAMEV